MNQNRVKKDVKEILTFEINQAVLEDKVEVNVLRLGVNDPILIVNPCDML